MTTNQSMLEAASATAVAEIAKMLKANPALRVWGAKNRRVELVAQQ